MSRRQQLGRRAPQHPPISPTGGAPESALRSLLGCVALLVVVGACGSDYATLPPTAPSPAVSSPPPAASPVAEPEAPSSETGDFRGTVKILEVSALDARTDLEHCAVREIARELRRRSGALELALDEQWDYGWGGWRARLSSELLECGRGCDGLWWSGEKGVDLEFGFADRTAFANTNASACPGEPLQFTGFLFNLPLSAAEGHHSDARLVFVIEHTENYFTEVLEVRVRLDLARARK